MRCRRFLLALSIVAAGLVWGGAMASAEESRAPILVELFTSQGCSSCPPADEFLAELDRRDDLVALSFHVNYWDYIGWKDPFASEATTERQKIYGERLSRGRVYTPQMVIDGILHAVGSDRKTVRRAIDKARSGKGLRLDIVASFAPAEGLKVSLPGAHFDGTATVWLARYDATQTTAVGRGENAGRTVRDYNVVRALRRIGTWSGLPLDIELPANVTMSGEGGRDGCAIIVQAEGQGRVLGVRKLVFARGS